MQIKNCHMKLKSLGASHSTSVTWWLLIKISCNNSWWKPSNSIFGDGKNELFYPPGSSPLRRSGRTRHPARVGKTGIYHTYHVLTFNLVFFSASNSLGKSRKVQKADWMQRWWFWGLGHNFDALDARGIGRAWTKRVFITLAMFSPSIWYFSGLLTPSESLERSKKLIECSDDDFEDFDTDSRSRCASSILDEGFSH